MSDQKLVERGAMSLTEFAEAHSISRSKLYQLFSEGRGPKTMQIGTRRLISVEAAAAWRRQMEAEADDN